MRVPAAAFALARSWCDPTEPTWAGQIKSYQKQALKDAFIAGAMHNTVGYLAMLGLIRGRFELIFAPGP